MAVTEVKAHARRGTNGVRRHTRRNFSVRIWKKDRFEDLPPVPGNKTIEYASFDPGATAVTFARRPYTTYLHDAREVVSPKEAVPLLSHETLHGVMNVIGEGHRTAGGIDRLPGYPVHAYHGLPASRSEREAAAVQANWDRMLTEPTRSRGRPRRRARGSL